MRRHIGWCFAVAIALAGVAGGAHAQSASQTGTQDTTHMNDSTTHKMKHHKHHKMTSNGSVADSTTTNQSQSGVVDSSGKSTLGPKIKKTTPTQGQPVTAKGDTLQPGEAGKAAPADTTKPVSPQ